VNTVEFTHPQSGEAAELIAELSAYLRDLTGSDGRDAYDVEVVNADKDAFVVLRLNDKPIACGAIHFVDRSTCEIKPMFSSRALPTGKVLGKEVLHVLENKAKLLGYTQVILSTRMINDEALTYYQKHGYRKIAPYGRHTNKPESVCLGKRLYSTP